MSSLLINALSGFAKYEEHDIPDRCKINILKPTLAMAEEMEKMSEGMDSETSGMAQLQSHVREIGLKYIVDSQGQPVFTEETIGSLLGAPADTLIDIVNAFKKTFMKMNAKAEDLSKKQ